jgi:hypothetical protein
MRTINNLLKTLKYAIVIIIIYSFCKFPGCGWNDPCYRNFGTHTTNTIKVDRVLLTLDTLVSTQTEGVRMWDTVGTNSGYTFKGIQVIRSANLIDLTLNNALDIDCGATVKDTIIVMNDYIYNITPPLSQGTNTVTVHQPDGGVINRYFYVR